MSERKQLEDFNQDFVTKTMKNWVHASMYYQREAEKSYSKLRSYLTMYQFRLSDKEKLDIREMLSGELDKIDNNDQVEDMDNYLDGFCFKMDTSILPKKETQLLSQQKSTTMLTEPVKETSVTSDTDMLSVTSDNAMDHNDLDIYTMQFFQ